MKWKQFRETIYEVSDSGQIRNSKRKSNVAYFMSNHYGKRYPSVGLYLSSGKQSTMLVHRVVAEVWCKNPQGKTEVKHLDGDKMNYHPKNLKWSTRSEIMHNMYDLGLKKYRPLHNKGKFGKDHNRSKKIRCVETGQEFGSMSEAERMLKLGQGCVSWSVSNKRPIFGMHFEIAA